MRALTALKQAGMPSQKTLGTPPEIPLAKIFRDPDNPRPPLHLRTPEEQQKQRELNANVKMRGVKSPISLRPHPTLPEIWVINHGHCRYDAAEAAGFATIPYFVDPNFDSYDQVAENLHRSDLSIWAIAEFIKRKLAEGDSKAEIAERLGKEGQNYVTEHLALVDAPSCIHQAYANAVRSPRTLYDLRRAYDEFPEQVDAWCSSGAKITRDSIRELLDRLRHDVIKRSANDKVGPSQRRPAHDRSRADLTGARQQDTPEMRIGATRQAELRHDVMSSPTVTEPSETPQLRHDVMLGSSPATPMTEPSHGALAAAEGILVRYKGNAARIAPDTRVTIVVDQTGVPVEVFLFELEFEGAR